ncbi:hypothetical protein GS426_04120 [Rhodococcus hoagii]|nr:hypothetical protein [Prescottella equi]
MLLARLGDTDDIVVGTPVAGSGERALDDLSECSSGPSRSARESMRGDRSGASRVGAQRRLGAFAHADVPFERSWRNSTPPVRHAYSPLFQVAWSSRNDESAGVELSGVRLEGVVDRRRNGQGDSS